MQRAMHTPAANTIPLFPTFSLRRLVHRHHAACVAYGLDPEAVGAGDDPSVLRWIREKAGVLPRSLAEDLEQIEELADERGASALLAIARDGSLDVRGFRGAPLEVAVNAFLDHREVFDLAHGRRVVSTVRGMTEFAGPGTAAAVLDLVAIQKLEVTLGRHFDGRARSAHCRVVVGRDGPSTIFTIAHGALLRADQALDEEPNLVREASSPVYLSERSLRYRPQRRDVVVYDADRGVLRVQAPEGPTTHGYRHAFGEALHGSRDAFGIGPVVSLEPLLRMGRDVEVPTPGVTEVQLIGLIVQYETSPRGTVALRSDAIWPFLESRVGLRLNEGRLVEATFRVTTAGRPNGAPLRLRGPGRVEYGRLEESAVRPWLEARGFVAKSR